MPGVEKYGSFTCPKSPHSVLSRPTALYFLAYPLISFILEYALSSLFIKLFQPHTPGQRYKFAPTSAIGLQISSFCSGRYPQAIHIVSVGSSFINSGNLRMISPQNIGTLPLLTTYSQSFFKKSIYILSVPTFSASALDLPFPKSKVSSAQILTSFELNSGRYSSSIFLTTSKERSSSTFTVWCCIFSINENGLPAASSSSHIYS